MTLRSSSRAVTCLTLQGESSPHYPFNAERSAGKL